MNVDVIVALIAAAASIIGVVVASVCTTRKANQDVLAKLDKSQSLMEQRIDELTKAVERHNNFASRLPTVEEKVSTLEREISEVRTATGLKGGKKQ